MASFNENEDDIEDGVHSPLLKKNDESFPTITVESVENEGDDITTVILPDVPEEQEENGALNNNAYKRYENVDDWKMSFPNNILAGLPSVKMRKKKASNLKMDQRRTIRQHDKVYCRVSKPPEQPPPLHERRQRLNRRQKSVRENIGSFVTSFRTATFRVYRTIKDKKRPKKWERFKMRLEDLKEKLTLWTASIREVEGRYGMAIMTYFKFIRWLFFLNIYLSIIMLAFVILPGSFMLPYKFEESLTVSNMTEYKATMTCSAKYKTYIDSFTRKLSTVDKILDFLEGTGWMETKVLFYGAYFNKTTINEFSSKKHTSNNIKIPTTKRPKRDVGDVLDKEAIVHYTIEGEDNESKKSNKTDGESEYELNYNMGVAYISAVGVCLIISFVKVVRNSAKNMKASYGREGKPAKYSSRVWAGWDFCICKEKHAKSKMASIRTDLIAEIQDTKKKDLWKRRSLTDKLMVYGFRIVINVLITILLGLSLAAIYKVTEQMMQLNSVYQDKLTSLMISFAPYLTITVLNFVVPKVCWRLTLYESYLHETEIKMSIRRAILLRLASPMVLLASIYVEIINVDTPPVCGNKRWQDSSSGLTKKIVIKCWENYIGQQLYRLALMDLIVTTFVIFCGNFPRKLIYDRWNSYRIVKFFGEQEFDLPRNVVDLVYSQYLCWLGMFFCPWIPLMTALKCFILFYLKKLTLVHNCRPEDRPYRTSRSISLFMTVLLWSFMLAVVPLIYVIKSLQPSQSCGPYRLYNGESTVIFDSIKFLVKTWPIWIQNFLSYLFSVGFWSIVIAILIVGCTSAWIIFVNGLKTKEKYLSNELYWEAKDKNYLIRLLKEEKDTVETLYEQYAAIRNRESNC
ncbi:transmembrane channel-like protein 7 [Mytilus californianus]|uniref:transmembrane channel-like protein 7 n=1 Tax=Mytilus californianus TaxID=6549 RepID=UPI002247699C|nr:transmembrane channel-like protein 7 [Mytilus californianus]